MYRDGVDGEAIEPKLSAWPPVKAAGNDIFQTSLSTDSSCHTYLKTLRIQIRSSRST